MRAWWPSGLERSTGDRVVLGSNPAAATSLRNFGNYFYPALTVGYSNSFYPALPVGEKDTLKAVGPFYLVGSKRSNQPALEMCK